MKKKLDDSDEPSIAQPGLSKGDVDRINEFNVGIRGRKQLKPDKGHPTYGPLDSVLDRYKEHR